MTPRIPLLKPLLTGLAVAAVLVLASGCESYREDWSGVPEQKAPKVNLMRYAHAVRFEPGSAHLEGRERIRLDDFLAKIQANPTDTVRVVGPKDAAALAVRRSDTVMAYLVLRSVEAKRGITIPGALAEEPDTVSVVVQRYSVTLPGCPDWSDNPAHIWDNTVGRNWGCATAVNLGLMVNDPADLAAGRVPGPMDGEAATLAIQRYRAGEVRALSPEDVGATQKQQKAGDSGGGSGGSQ